MVEMLSLPKGEEIKFIEEQAAEGRIVAEMFVKTLRVEMHKYKSKLALVNGGADFPKVRSSVPAKFSVD